MENKRMKIFLNGLIYENPLLILMLGICPALATTAKAVTALAMGLTTLVVLTCTNIVASAFKRMIPESVRIPAYMIMIGGFVCISEVIIHTYFPEIYAQLDVYLSLVAVNCLILGRAEGFARKNSIVNSAIDGISMGLGYTVAITAIGIVRELLGFGTLFGVNILAGHVAPMQIFTLAPGAFIALGFVAAGVNKLRQKKSTATFTEKNCEGCPASAFCAESTISNRKGGIR